MIEIILVIVMALLSSWEELQQLVQRGSWKKDMFYSFLFWETKWDGKWKLFDSHHVAFGAFVLCTIMVLIQGDLHKFTLFLNLVQFLQFSEILNKMILVALLWWFFFYIRNIGLHILLRRKHFRQWKYLLPIQKIGG